MHVSDRRPDALQTVQSHQQALDRESGATDLLVRNYDLERAYRLTLTVETAEQVVYERRYRLLPGQVVAESGILSPSEYDVRVTLACAGEDETTCRVSEDPAHTIRVEVGNGLVSVGDGAY